MTDHTASQGEVHVLLPSLAPRAKASKARQPGDLVPEKCRENHGFSTFNTNQTLRIAGFFGLIHKPTRMLETKNAMVQWENHPQDPKPSLSISFWFITQTPVESTHSTNTSGWCPPQSHHPCSCAEVMQQARLAALNKTWFSSTTSLIWPATIFKKMTKTDGEIDNSHVK